MYLHPEWDRMQGWLQHLKPGCPDLQMLTPSKTNTYYLKMWHCLKKKALTKILQLTLLFIVYMFDHHKLESVPSPYHSFAHTHPLSVVYILFL